MKRAAPPLFPLPHHSDQSHYRHRTHGFKPKPQTIMHGWWPLAKSAG